MSAFKQVDRNKTVAKQNRPVLVGFRNAYVFDVSQTEAQSYRRCARSRAMWARIATAC
jgi:hypothetical protein